MAYSERVNLLVEKGLLESLPEMRARSQEPGILLQGQGGETPLHRYLTCGLNGGNSKVCSLEKSMLTQARL